MQVGWPRVRTLPVPSPGPAAALLIALAATAGIGYLAYQRLAPAPPLIERNTARVTRGDLVAGVSSTGTVVSTATSRLVFKETGRVAEVLVKVGDTVEAGQVLARQDTADLQLAIDQARANLQASQARLAATRAGPSTQEIVAAEAALEAAQARLDLMLGGSRPEEIVAARASLGSATIKIQWLEAGPDSKDVRTAQASIRNAQANLESARAKLQQVLAGPAQADLVAAETSLTKAQADRANAQANATKVRTNPTPQPLDAIVAADQGIVAADATVKAAEAKLQQLRAGPTQADVVAAQNAVLVAENNVRLEETRLQQLLAGPDQAELAAARASAAQAQNALALKVTPYTDAEILAQEQAIKQAQANLEAKRLPYSDADILSARAGVVKAEADLATALNNLAGAALLAPFDGVVSAVNLSIGEIATTAGTNPSSVTVVDPSQVRVDVQVDEADIAQIAAGAPARLTFDALPGRTFQGAVSAVAPAGSLTQGVVGYQVSIDLESPRGVRPGMTAIAEIIHDQRSNVLVVPNRAISRQGRERFVDLVTPTGAERRKVEVGMTSDQSTEILAGLEEGDEVVLPQTQARAAIPRGARGQFGGEGFGGGGFVVPGGPGGPGGPRGR